MHTGLVHTILFCRTLGLVRPKDVDCELFDITYVSAMRKALSLYSSFLNEVMPLVQVQCDDPELEARVETGISDFCSLIERKPSDTAQVTYRAFPSVSAAEPLHVFSPLSLPEVSLHCILRTTEKSCLVRIKRRTALLGTVVGCNLQKSTKQAVQSLSPFVRL